MLQKRDLISKTLSEPIDQSRAERARLKFQEFQSLIESIDRAIVGKSVVV